jgi:DNA invertase Pin-like site-specific DNA recombinase
MRSLTALVTPAGRLMANILAGVAAYETEARAERILAGQASARERGGHRGGSIRGRRSRATVEPIAVIRRLKSEGEEIAAIARATGLSRSMSYRILGEDGNASSGFSDGGPIGRVVCGKEPV